MLSTVTKEIDGDTYMCGQLPAWKGLKLITKLTRIAGGAVAGLASLKGGMLESDLTAYIPVVMGLTDKLTPAEMESLAKEMLEGMRQNGVELLPTFNILMAGRILTVLKLMIFSFEVNFADFLAGYRARVAEAEAKKAAEEKARETETASST